MSILKPLAFALVGLAIGIGGGSAALAKGHDQGVADGTQPFGPGARAGLVDDVVSKGSGGDPDFIYGQDVVKGEAQSGTRRVDPHERPGGFPPGKNK
jgi:hypothetical protein